jgi:hypothetical protein
MQQRKCVYQLNLALNCSVCVCVCVCVCVYFFFFFFSPPDGLMPSVWKSVSHSIVVHLPNSLCTNILLIREEKIMI